MRTKGFADLRALVISGLRRYWSRRITLRNGDVCTVTKNLTPTTKKAMDDISIVYNTNGEWLRSSNPGGVRGLYSLFGNFVPERIAYNVGWIKFPIDRIFVRTTSAAQRFRKTSAHEIGHEILSAYGGNAYSYRHRGSSTLMA